MRDCGGTGTKSPEAPARCPECGGSDKACALGEACDEASCHACGMAFRGPHWRLTDTEVREHKDRCGGTGTKEGGKP